MIKVKTIIIGGGISGLACGNKLNKYGEDFILITKDLGGRIKTSSDYSVNLGAVYVTEDYKNVLQFVDKGEKIKIKNAFFFNGQTCQNIYNLRLVLETPKLIKLFILLTRFKKQLSQFRKQAEFFEQKELLQHNQTIRNLLNETSSDFITKNNLSFLTDNYINPIFESTFFTDIKQTSVICFLGSLIALVSDTYKADFTNTIKKITYDWETKIKTTTVTKIIKSNNIYTVETLDDSFVAENVVLALPYKDLIKIYNDIPLMDNSVSTYTLRIWGKRKKDFSQDLIFMKPNETNIAIIFKQSDGSDILYSKEENPDLSKFYDLIDKKESYLWHTAVSSTCNNESRVMSQNLGNNLYLASDYNGSSLEDSFITGIYAANHISGKCFNRGN